MQKRYQIAACSGQAIEVKAGDKITIIDVEGQQVVDFFAVHAFDFEECLSTGVTIDCNASLKLRIGDTIYTNRYRPMFKLMQDDVGEHDLLHPCCREQMYEFFYGSAPGHSNCLDAINDCLRPYGVVKRDLIHPVNFFMHTQIHADASISVKPPKSKAGDRVSLLAQMDALIGMSACSVQESDCNGGRCTPIQVLVQTP